MFRFIGALAMVVLIVPLVSSADVTPAAKRAISNIGVAFPSLQRLKYYTESNLLDVHVGLHSSFVRTGWIPDGMKHDKVPWQREDRAMHRICRKGLKVMIITPSPKDDSKGEEDLYRNIDGFFARYNEREPGCVEYAEIGNEADLPQNGFADVSAYARYYERIAPAISAYGIKVITSGTSGKDTPWTYKLALLLNAARVPVDGFGFHPYGVDPRSLRNAIYEMRRAASAGMERLPEVYVTELGEKDSNGLYTAIVTLAYQTPAIAVFEYVVQDKEDRGYGLKDDPKLFGAMQSALQEINKGATIR